MTVKKYIIEEFIKPMYDQLDKDGVKAFLNDYINDQILATNLQLERNINTLSSDESTFLLERISAYSIISKVLEKIFSFQNDSMKENLSFQKELYVAIEYNNQITDYIYNFFEKEHYTKGEDITENEFFMEIVSPCFLIQFVLEKNIVNTTENKESLLEKYRELTLQIYNQMPQQKQREWIFDFISSSLNQSENFLLTETLTNEAEFFLKQKIDRLKTIMLVISSFYKNKYLNAERNELKNLIDRAIDYNNSIIKQIIDLTFNQGMSPEERKEQLSGVLNNYLFVEFELNKFKLLVS